MPLQITNTRDTARKFRTAALSPRTLTEAEGTVIEKVTGPAASATVSLSKPAISIVMVQAFVTATGVWAAVPVLREGIDYDVTLRNGSGVAELLEKTGGSQAANTWVVWYKRDEPEPPEGGLSQAVVGGP